MLFMNNARDKTCEIRKEIPQRLGEREWAKKWSRPLVGDDCKAMCRYCKCKIRAHHADLVHVSTEKHKRLTDIGFTISKPNESRQRSELKVATYVACHTSIKVVDHLGELIGSTCDKGIKMHGIN